MLRFDSPVQTGWNILALGLWLIVVVDAIRLRRARSEVPTGHWLAIFLNLSVDDSFLPIAPAIWLVTRLVARMRRSTTTTSAASA